MPAFRQVLPEVTEGTQTQLPPDVCRILLLGQEDLPQSLDFLLHLHNITSEGTVRAGTISLPRVGDVAARHLRKLGPQVVDLLVRQV